MQRRQALTLFGLALGQTACTLSPDFNHDGADAPSVCPLKATPQVAWVFGTGGPRGFVHVGVIKALNELGLKPDLIVGASAGAIIGVLCAAGFSGKELEAMAMDMQAWHLMRWNPMGEERLSGSGLSSWINKHLGDRRLEQLPTPVVVAAQNLTTGQVVGFNCGDAGTAVQASSAIVGRLAPVRIRGVRFVDADLVMPLPVRLAKGLGARRVLAVDASAHEDKAPEGAARFRESDHAKRALTNVDAKLADGVIHPDIGYWANISEAYRERVIKLGYADTMSHAKQLEALHRRG